MAPLQFGKMFRGTFTALVTPFRNGDVDVSAFEKLIETQIAGGITGIVAATIGVWFSWRLARRFSDNARAAIAVLALWLGSHALYYTLISPSYSHAASMLTSGLFFWRWLSRSDEPSVTCGEGSTP